VRVGVQYIEAWLRGKGAVPLYNLMEDAATAEISRAQVWQWIHYGITLEGGTVANPELLNRVITEEMARVRTEVGAETYDNGRFKQAVELFRTLSLADDFEDFLTVPAMGLLRPAG
jgi:malate synthase